MSLLENLRIALDSLMANRLRAALTTLGIIIGVGAVIALVSLGRGVEEFVADEFRALGSNLLFVFSSVPTSPTRSKVEPLTTREAEALANPMIAPSIRQVATEYDIFAQVVGGSESLSANVMGVSANYAEVRNWFPRDGAFISDQDVASSVRVVVLGIQVVEDLFGDRDYDPVGRTVRINDRVFTVIGVMEEQGSAFSDEDESVLIPISTAQTRLSNVRTRDGGYRLTLMHVQAVNEERMDEATQQIEAYLTQAHGVTFEGEQDFTIINQADLLDTFGQITGVLTVFLGLIAGVALLVGGIGIMNIMLVTVTERTQEIGLRKAVGAPGSAILTQFLIESLLLSILGGIMGVGLGWLGTRAGVALVPDLKLAVTWDAVLLATVVSGFVGVFFGLYPASRAARLRPIEALRFE